MRRRSVTIVTALLAVLVSGVVAWRFPLSPAVDVRTPDGHFQFRMPAGWQVAACATGDCFEAGPPETADRVRLSIDLATKPTAVHYPVSDTLTLIVPRSAGTDGTVDGRSAIRMSGPTAALIVHLDPGGDIATVSCPASGTLANGCAMVMTSLHIRWS